MNQEREFWCEKYRGAGSGTLEGKIFIAACYVVCHAGQETVHEETCRAIGKIAFEQNVCIWHACSIHWDTLDICSCTPCRKGRMEA